MIKRYLDKKGLKLYDSKVQRKFKILSSQWEDIKVAVNNPNIKETVITEVIASRTDNKGNKSSSLDDRLMKLDDRVDENEKETGKNKNAIDVNYNPIETELTSKNVQDAITEVANASIKNIPQANELFIGGIKASIKTEEETQEVKIDTETGHLYVKPSGGDGGGDYSRLTLKIVGDTFFLIPKGSNCKIQYTYSSLDSTGQDTGDATVTYYVNGINVLTKMEHQGLVSFDVTEYLANGDNEIRVKVTDTYGSFKSVTYQVKLLVLDIDVTFDTSIVYNNVINVRYTPIGDYEKNVIFKIDNTEISRIVTKNSGKPMSIVLPQQPHGGHTLEVYVEANVNKQIIKSKVVSFNFISTDSVTKTPIVIIDFFDKTASQFSTVNIPFMVYTPDTLNSDVSLYVDNVKVSTRTSGREKQVWSLYLGEIGTKVLKIESGQSNATISIEVTKVDVDVSAETNNLQLWLTSQGRSNSDTNKTEWSYGDIKSDMTGFNYISDGWMVNDVGIPVLRVSEYAKVDILVNPFSDDARMNGKCIEFEFSTSNVTDYDAILISCIHNGKGLLVYPQKAVLSSELTSVETQFKEDEIVRVSFVITSKYNERLIFTYINGIVSGIARYPELDSFTQSNPQNITIGSQGAVIDLMNIRIYNMDLNQTQILNNYIADTALVDKKIKIYSRNNVFDDYGQIQYNKVVNQIPCMTIIGSLPQYKGDKKKVGIEYRNLQEVTKSFTSENVSLNVQGTSSQYYPRKNYKLKFSKFIDNEGNESSGYSLREDSIPVNTFCTKADFAESSGTHNTGMAKIADTYLKDLGFLTPPQKIDSKIRTTIDGFPIVIFHKENKDSEPTFLGKYNFNNDKSTQDTFGFSGENECWEFCNNTSERTLFKISEYESVDENGEPQWLSDFEGRYPDEFTDCKNFKILTDWIVSTIDNPSKFKSECEKHFNINFLLSYYLFTEIFGMVDQRAKNMFFATWGNEGSGDCKWYPILYDNDTCLGLNNEGKNVFDYKIEYHDTIGTQSVWNGEESVLWKNVELSYSEEIVALYKRIRSENILKYEDILQVLNHDQADKWCESIYNSDQSFKYIEPNVDEYLMDAHGSREEHRIWWLYNRLNYMDSKYSAGSYMSDYLTMRIYNPTNCPIKPNFDFNLVPYMDEYVRVKYGSTIISRRGYKNSKVFVEAPSGNYNDTETIIYGASRLKDIGDLSLKYPNTVDVSKATSLTSLIIGRDDTEYVNTNLTSLKLGNNKMLRVIDARGCVNLVQPLDLTGCDNIEEVYVNRTGVTSVILPKASHLKKIYYSDSMTRLELKNMNIALSQTNITGDIYKKCNTIIVENCPNIDTFSMVGDILTSDKHVLEKLRITGIDGYLDDITVLEKILDLKGIDGNGNELNIPYISGKLTIGIVTKLQLAYYKKAFPDLKIDYKSEAPDYHFEDAEVERIFLSKVDTKHRTYVVKDNLSSVLKFNGAFTNSSIKHFKELSLFTNVQFLSSEFEGCSQLETIEYNRDYLPDKIFKGCTKVLLNLTVNDFGVDSLLGCKNDNSVLTINEANLPLTDNIFGDIRRLKLNVKLISANSSCVKGKYVYMEKDIFDSYILDARWLGALSDKSVIPVYFYYTPRGENIEDITTDVYIIGKWYSDFNLSNLIRGKVYDGTIIYGKVLFSSYGETFRCTVIPNPKGVNYVNLLVRALPAYIDWGDGTPQEDLTTALSTENKVHGTIRFKHTYEDKSKDYQIKILSKSIVALYGYNSDYHTSGTYYKNISYPTIYYSCFDGYLKSIDYFDEDKLCIGLCTFKNEKNLQAIPSRLMKCCDGESCQELFLGCVGIKELPEDLFGEGISLARDTCDMLKTFSGTSISDVPVDIFKNCSIEVLDGTFANTNIKVFDKRVLDSIRHSLIILMDFVSNKEKTPVKTTSDIFKDIDGLYDYSEGYFLSIPNLELTDGNFGEDWLGYIDYDRIKEFNGKNDRHSIIGNFSGDITNLLKKMTNLENVDYYLKRRRENIPDYIFQGLEKLNSADYLFDQYGAGSNYNFFADIPEHFLYGLVGVECLYLLGHINGHQTLNFPKGMDIDSNMFKYNGLDSLTITNTEGMVALTSTNLFDSRCDDHNKTKPIVYVPDSLLSQYKSATNWLTYAEYIKPISEKVVV